MKSVKLAWDSKLVRLLVGLLLAYGASAILRGPRGLVPSVPWGFFVLLALKGVPFALLFLWLAKTGAVVNRWTGSLLAAGAVVLVTLCLQLDVLWLSIGLALVLFSRRGSVRSAGRIFLIIPILFAGYATVWNLNYVLARSGPVHRWDPVLHGWDLTLYSWLLHRQVDYTGLFPLIHQPLLLRILDNAYATLIPELLLVSVLLSELAGSDAAAGFLKRLFGLYALGIAIFLVFPAVGPDLYYPESTDLGRSLPNVVNFMTGMLHDYNASRAGGEVYGYGYFIAVPSLHVLVALYLQTCLRPFPILFRVFAPINAAVIVSTVALGYHYWFDVAAAVAIYAACAAGGRLLRARAPSPPTSAAQEVKAAARAASR